MHWSDFGAQRYQQLVPSFTVMFPFFLAMVVGWVFVTERRQGTLKRLRFAPVSRAQILAGKLLPCFVLSMGLAAFLLLAGRLIFQMSWGPASWPLWEQVGWLLPVVTATSFASMGLALLVAAVSRSEIQVALFGALPVLVMALVSGCILPREMMTGSAQALSWFTPHGWALAAYRELLGDDPQYVPDLWVVAQSCGVLTAFGAGFLGLAWVCCGWIRRGPHRMTASSMKVKKLLVSGDPAWSPSPRSGFVVIRRRLMALTREEENYSLIEDGLYLGGDVARPPPGTRAVLNLCEKPDSYRADVALWEPIADAEPAPDVEWLRRMVQFVDFNRREVEGRRSSIAPPA